MKCKPHEVNMATYVPVLLPTFKDRLVIAVLQRKSSAKQGFEENKT